MTQSELDRLAHGIAYTSCVSLIECECLCVESNYFAEPAYDVRRESVSVYAGDAVAESVLYLDRRGLLQREPERDYVVCILEESEASDVRTA